MQIPKLLWKWLLWGLMMFNSYLNQTNPKAIKYFENLITKYFKGEKNIPNSIILWGSDSLAQYMFALEIARILNCKKNHDENCDCLNCNWIRKNEHPEIKTVSKINSKPSNDETKNISVKQVKELLEQMSMKSSDYRVLVFCDADFEKLSQDQISVIENFGDLRNAIKNDGGKYWTPKPINSKVFQEESANALLKTIEETPDRLTFIFLTSSPNDLISTIVSRSQMFYIQNTFEKKYDFSEIKEIFKAFPNTQKQDFEEFTSKSLSYIEDKSINLFDYLEIIQAYFTELLKENYSDVFVKEKMLDSIKNIIEAKKYYLASVKPEYVLDDFWVNIS